MFYNKKMDRSVNTYNLSDTLIYNLECTARIARISAYRYFEECKEINITFNEAVIIDALYTNPKIHQRDLARILFKGTANLSRDLEKLETRGLIKRNIDTKGKRVVKTLMLTPEGEKVYHDVSIRVHNHIAEIENVFSPEEYQHFISLISKLKGRLTKSSDMIFE